MSHQPGAADVGAWAAAVGGSSWRRPIDSRGLTSRLLARRSLQIPQCQLHRFCWRAGLPQAVEHAAVGRGHGPRVEQDDGAADRARKGDLGGFDDPNTQIYVYRCKDLGELSLK